MEDVGVVFPLRALRTLERGGRIGAAAPRHYSFMGYATETGVLRDNGGGGRAAAAIGRGPTLALLVPS